MFRPALERSLTSVNILNNQTFLKVPSVCQVLPLCSVEGKSVKTLELCVTYLISSRNEACRLRGRFLEVGDRSGCEISIPRHDLPCGLKRYP